jgi:hypothetical protein
MATTNPNASNPTATQPSASPAAQTPITGTANGSNHSTKIDLQTAYQALITGLTTFYQSTDTFALKSGTLTRDAVIEQLQKFIDAAEATKASRTAWLSTVQAERAVEAQVHPIRVAIRGIVAARYGSDGTQLVQFGFTPSKHAKKSAVTKAQAAVKSKATRTARATKGSKQKKTVKGNVTGIVVTPTTSASGVVVAAPSAVSASGVAGPAAGAPATPHAA